MHLSGVFNSVGEAEQARARLVEAGVTPLRITLSASAAEDDIAAEWVGQAFENQPGQADDGSVHERAQHDEARYTEAVQAGMCVLSLDVDDGEATETHASVMENAGARSVWVKKESLARRLV